MRSEFFSMASAGVLAMACMEDAWLALAAATSFDTSLRWL